MVDLLPKDSLIEDFDSRGWSSLHVAAARGNLEVLCCLVAHTDISDIAGKQMSKDTSLGLAAEYDKADAIEILAAAGATIETRNSAKTTPLMIPALEGCSIAVRKLITLSAEVNCHNSLEFPLLLLCRRMNKSEARLHTFRAMLDTGACLDGIDNSIDWTPLHRATG